jgi:hypothetical protein
MRVVLQSLYLLDCVVVEDVVSDVELYISLRVYIDRIIVLPSLRVEPSDYPWPFWGDRGQSGVQKLIDVVLSCLIVVPFVKREGFCGLLGSLIIGCVDYCRVDILHGH